jgi:putative transposase
LYLLKQGYIEFFGVKNSDIAMARAKRRYGVLNYTVTSNHLLVADDKSRGVIADSIKLIAGRTGQEFIQRKARKGAFWEDRYHATAIEDGDHLKKMHCLHRP